MKGSLLYQKWPLLQAHQEKWPSGRVPADRAARLGGLPCLLPGAERLRVWGAGWDFQTSRLCPCGGAAEPRAAVYALPLLPAQNIRARSLLLKAAA